MIASVFALDFQCFRAETDLTAVVECLSPRIMLVFVQTHERWLFSAASGQVIGITIKTLLAMTSGALLFHLALSIRATRCIITIGPTRGRLHTRCSATRRGATLFETSAMIVMRTFLFAIGSIADIVSVRTISRFVCESMRGFAGTTFQWVVYTKHGRTADIIGGYRFRALGFQFERTDSDQRRSTSIV